MASAYLSALSEEKDPKVLFVELVRQHGLVIAIRQWAANVIRDGDPDRVPAYERGKQEAAQEVSDIMSGKFTTQSAEPK